MKIVHVIFSLNTGGSEVMLVDILNEQVKTQSVSLVIINNKIQYSILKQIDNRVNIVLIGRKEKSKNILPIVRLNLQIFLIKPDVIHCHNHSSIRMIFFRKNIVITVHEIDKPTNHLKYYRKIFAISKTVKINIKNRSNFNSILVYNGIKIDDIKYKKNYTFDTFRIVQVSRLDHKIKGQHILLLALKILVYENNIKNIYVDFIGEGNSLNFLNKLITEYQLENHVNFLGARDRKFIYKHLKNYNLLVQPSLIEGFGLTITEAMAAKVPVLVSDIDGPLEIVESEKYGWIFESKNIEHCAKEIFKIYNKYESVPLICNNAFFRAKKLFNIINTSKSYQKNYKLLSNS